MAGCMGLVHCFHEFALHCGMTTHAVHEEVMGGTDAQREEQQHCAAQGLTMVGLRRLDNLEMLADKLRSEGVPGDFIECGVWRGGASIFMRGLLRAHDIRDRTIHLVDSFNGVCAHACPGHTCQRSHQCRWEAFLDPTTGSYSLMCTCMLHGHSPPRCSADGG